MIIQTRHKELCVCVCVLPGCELADSLFTVVEYADEIPFTKPAPIDELETKKQKKDKK